jgi:nucleoside-diphosphate-sugar epimerase
VVVTLSPGEMSDAAYKATYVDGLHNILATLNTSALRKLFWVSSTSVYGQSDGSDVDETSATEPARYAGQRQLQAEQLLKALGDKACVVRFSGIYREGRHRMIEQIRAGKISSQVENDYITNRIHIADCVGVLQHLINLDAAGKTLQPVYLASDSSPVHYSELVFWLAKEMGVTLPNEGGEQTPRVGSKRCVNARLLESGYQFVYLTFRDGFAKLLEA